MRRFAPIAVILALVVLVAGIAVVGRSRTGGTPETPPPSLGNPELARAAARILGEDRGEFAVAHLSGGATRFAYLGADPALEYEIGSLTKVMTGQLLAEAVRREELTLDTPVGDLLDLGDAPVGAASLESLATYRSGLSLWGPPGEETPDWLDRVVVANPHELSRTEMLRRAQLDPLETRGEFSYSNLGHALLGTALAADADMSYDRLLQERLLDPLGMDRTRVGRADDRNQSRGFTEDGRRSLPWNLRGFASAGGVRSTIGDMALWARSIMALPIGAPDPFAGRFVDEAGDGVGFGSYTATIDGREIIWKTGQTGGFASLLVVDREGQRAVVVLSRSAVPFDIEDLALLDAVG